jgi:hypothetical protein
MRGATFRPFVHAVFGAACALVVSAIPASAAAEPRSAPATRPPENASRLRVVEARIESQTGRFDDGQLYVHITDDAGTPVVEVPLAVVTSGGVHVGPFVPLGGGSFVAHVEWERGTAELSARLAVGDATADVPPLALPRYPSAPKRTPREARGTVFALGSLGLGAGTLDGQLGLVGLRGAMDWSLGLPLGKAGLSAALGVHLGYERHWSQYVRGLVPGRTIADVSILEAGVPLTVRFGNPEPALVVPYLVVTPTFYVQNSRFVLPGTQIVDVDGHFFGVPVTFGVEIPVGPGGVFVQGTYRAAFEVGDGGEAVPLRGGLGEAGYHLLF